ncbi:MAG: aromatic-ring-hydroxylating dioxygenase subunit beta [Chloroflexota bacterium]|nr:aromatic-ring-hydroxylating dioxygenase subunit beta [Chloroflexota bacterium]MDE2886087.1 aromatic-ring-hydroxylating dioxygenase subunit beta [Chloroflexota bacterium]
MGAGESLQHEVEQFLYHEARLLDRRQFNEWYDLFAEDSRYFVPSMSADSDPTADAYIVHENRKGIQYRVSRLQHGSAHTQIPPARTAHMITNVIVEELGDGEVQTSAGYVVFWSRGAVEARYAGLCEHHLRRANGGWEIVEKKVSLLNNDQPTDRLPLL